MTGKIRPISIALIQHEDKFLLLKAFDKQKNLTFYRPLGGGIEFKEFGCDAVEREIQEEINQKLCDVKYVGLFENIFHYLNLDMHELVLVYSARFKDPKAYQLAEFEIIERSQVVHKAYWVTLAEIKKQKAKIYPEGIEDFMKDKKAA